MTHQLILNVPAEVYESLADSAKRAGATPEKLAVDWIDAVGRHAARDPVEGFIGAFRSDTPDWADRHDDYLGGLATEPPRQDDERR
jgi:hypothetical protein